MEHTLDSKNTASHDMKPINDDILNFTPIMNMTSMPVMNISPIITSTYPYTPINVNHYSNKPIMPSFEDLFAGKNTPLLSVIEEETKNANNDVDKDSFDKADNIFKEIEKNNPAIISTFMAYRMPYPATKMFLKKIINLSIKYNK